MNPLALRAPEETVRRGRMGGGQTAPESQLEFEHLVYGGPEGRARFAADLEDYVRRLRPSSRLSFYFGIHDPVSAAGDLPPSFEGHASVTIVRANHESVGAASSVWQDIIEKMGISPVARSSQPSNPPAQSRAGPHVFPPLNAVMRRNEAGTS